MSDIGAQINRQLQQIMEKINRMDRELGRLKVTSKPSQFVSEAEVATAGWYRIAASEEEFASFADIDITAVRGGVITHLRLSCSATRAASGHRVMLHTELISGTQDSPITQARIVRNADAEVSPLYLDIFIDEASASNTWTLIIRRAHGLGFVPQKPASAVVPAGYIQNTYIIPIRQYWVSLPLQNGWQNTGGAAPFLEYMKDGSDTVFLRGGITGTAGQVVATLPTGYRPNTQLIYVCAASSGASHVTISYDGTITCSGSGTINVYIPEIQWKSFPV